MSFRAAKISFDGSHYIATPKEHFPQGRKRRRAARPQTLQETERKEQFEAAYKESQKLPHKERKAYMRKALEETIPDREQRRNTSSAITSESRPTPSAGKCDYPKKSTYRETGIFSVRSPIRMKSIQKRVLRNRFAIPLNTSLTAKAGSISAYGNAAEIRITVPKTGACRRRVRIHTFSNDTAETIFSRSARRRKCGIRLDT